MFKYFFYISLLLFIQILNKQTNKSKKQLSNLNNLINLKVIYSNKAVLHCLIVLKAIIGHLVIVQLIDGVTIAHHDATLCFVLFL